jgi:chemotaxis protein MotB
LGQPSNINNLAKLQKELAIELQAEIKRGDVAIKAGREGLVVSLREIGFFESGSADVKLKSEPSVSRIARVLEHGNYQVRIEGHTDNVPIHTAHFASNWELSTSRATEMAKLFITRYGYPPDHLSAAGYAEFHPVASNETAGGRAMNRRIDLVVIAPSNKALSRPEGGVAVGPSRPSVFEH